MAESWQVCVDTGGTFTDCVARDPTGRIHRAKVLSTSSLRATIVEVPAPALLRISESWGAPRDFVSGFDVRLQGSRQPLGRASSFDPVEGTLELADVVQNREGLVGAAIELQSAEPAPLLAARLVTGTAAGRPLPESLRLRVATTRATNALLERRGAPLALFVTRGFRDLLRIGDQQRPDIFALDVARPNPLPEAVVEVVERLAADGSVREELNLDDSLRSRARGLRARGIRAAAIALLHSYRNPEHEEALAELLREEGFTHIALSSATAPFINLLRRGETATVEGYLGPVIRDYVGAIQESISDDRLLVMTSTGGLVRGDRVLAKDTLLSGPAGGVVGAASVGVRSGSERVIAFDMGGTSTDVSRFDGEYEYAEEHRVGDARLRSPALAIQTVAAGGGSICSIDDNGLRVGPESAGADPGPACYGAGGPLTLTDVNLLLGRVEPRRFGIPVRRDLAEVRAREVLQEVTERTGEDTTLEQLLEGFLEIANERMADAVRRISVRKGYDPAEYALVAFGGAGPQHACALASRLGIERILIPYDAGVLSATGLAHAVVERFRYRQVLADLQEAQEHLLDWLGRLEEEARAEVIAEGIAASDVVIRQRIAHLRYRGQESTLEVAVGDDPGTLRAAFEEAYEGVYGHRAESRAVEVESLRVVASAREVGPATLEAPDTGEPGTVSPTRGWFGGEWRAVPGHARETLVPGVEIVGPALVLDPHSAIVIEEGWTCRCDASGTLLVDRIPTEVGGFSGGTGVGDAGGAKGAGLLRAGRPEAVEEELFVQRFRSLVEEMGEQLRRTALSVNIRERLDFSCTLLDPEGRLVANAPHMPVHLGAMGICVRRVVETLELAPGDVAMTNHPAFGGSHLPDVTLITPVFADDGSTGESRGGSTDRPPLLGYVASRAHHAEMGGTRPGSMPPDASTLLEEGVVIPPTLIVRGGTADWEGTEALLCGARYPSRAVEENLVDLAAQLASNHRGATLLSELARTVGSERVLDHMSRLRARAERRMRDVLRAIPDGSRSAEERLDDGSPIVVDIRVSGDEAEIDFTGSAGVHPGNLNATEAVVRSAVLYLLRLLAGEELPLNEGLMEPVRLILPEGMLNPRFHEDPSACPAVVGGNTETSQRIVDTILKPFEMVAGSQGTMNNFLFGDDSFSYYETIGGGAGAGPTFHGAGGTQVHMTNTRITDTEVLEHRFPVRVERFHLRSGSGGDGLHHGGEGVVREVTFLQPLSISFVTQHRVEAPYGIRGGEAGRVGSQRLVTRAGESRPLSSVDGCEVEAGDRIIIETPGGGGYGKPVPDGPGSPGPVGEVA
ncbi:MAG: hydantoinase B/oxoprolinase family protein [Gemmatimonadota bacterium]